VADKKSDDFKSKSQKSEPTSQTKLEKEVLDPKTEMKLNFPMLKPLVVPNPKRSPKKF